MPAILEDEMSHECFEVQVEGKVVDDFNGRFTWVMDPEGNKIELWEPKAGF